MSQNKKVLTLIFLLSQRAININIRTVQALFKFKRETSESFYIFPQIYSIECAVIYSFFIFLKFTNI